VVCGDAVVVQSPPSTTPRCAQEPAATVGAGACFRLLLGAQAHPKDPKELTLLWPVPQPGPTGDTRWVAGEGEAGAGSPRPLAATTALTSILSGFSTPLILPGQMAASWGSWGRRGDSSSAPPRGHGPRSHGPVPMGGHVPAALAGVNGLLSLAADLISVLFA